MPKKINDLTVSDAVPDVIVGGSNADNRFVTFTKTVLSNFLKSLISARVNGITLTGITGSVITDSRIANRIALAIIVDDISKNIGFSKETEASDTIQLTDLVLKGTEKVTILFA